MRRQNKFPLLPLAITALLLLMLGALYFGRPAQLDPKTACPKAGPKSSTVLIIDTSDPLVEYQQKRLEKLADLLTDPKFSENELHVPRGHLLAIYEVDSPEPKRLFHLCNPGDPEARDWHDKLNQGDILPRLRWKRFIDTLAKAFPDVTQSTPQTPLIETIRFVRHAEFPPASVLRGGDTRAGRIVIISDMLQHTAQLSHFGARLPPAADAAKTYSLDLRGIDIHLRYLRVDRFRQYQQGARPHFTWWREFFASTATGSPLKHEPEVW